MGICDEIYSKNKKNIEDAIFFLSEREKALQYIGKSQYVKEFTEAREKLIVLLGKLEGMKEKYPDKIMPTEVHIIDEGANPPRAAMLVAYRGKSMCLSHALTPKKEIFYINTRPLATISRH